MLIVPVVLGLVLGSPIAAQTERVTVRVDGQAVLRIGASEEADAATRVRQIERRLAAILEHPDSLAPVLIEPNGGDAAERVLSIAGVPIVTITQSDAEDNLTTVDALAVQWAAALDGALEQARAQRLSWGGRFIAEVRASIQTAFSRLHESILRVIPRALASVMVLGLFGLAAAFVRRTMRVLFRRIISDKTVEHLLEQLTYYAVWTLGLLVAVDALGFDPRTVVAGLGLTGLALGFALKDILSNFVSGLLILGLRPFEIGDQIVVGETEGSVERIELRATYIGTYDGRLVLVPNAEVFTSRVTNNTAAPVRRGSVTFPVAYATDLSAVKTVVLSATTLADGVLVEPAPSVRVRELGKDDILFEARFWTDSRRSDYILTGSMVRINIVEALRSAGIALPDSVFQLRVDDPVLSQADRSVPT